MQYLKAQNYIELLRVFGSSTALEQTVSEQKWEDIGRIVKALYDVIQFF
jgi:hypothetical protein